MANQTLFYKNAMLLELNGLQNIVDNSFLNAATATVTLIDSSGVEVTGETWPLVMSYVAASDGDYRATLVDTLNVTLDDRYVAQVSADAGGGLKGYWEFPMIVKERKFT